MSGYIEQTHRNKQKNEDYSSINGTVVRLARIGKEEVTQIMYKAKRLNWCDRLNKTPNERWLKKARERSGERDKEKD